jgi:hypothetical protein
LTVKDGGTEGVRDSNLLKTTGCRMHQLVEHFNNYMLSPHNIYVFGVNPKTNSELCHSHQTLIGSYNRDETCLQRGMDWGFK